MQLANVLMQKVFWPSLSSGMSMSLSISDMSPSQWHKLKIKKIEKKEDEQKASAVA